MERLHVSDNFEASSSTNAISHGYDSTDIIVVILWRVALTIIAIVAF